MQLPERLPKSRDIDSMPNKERNLKALSQILSDRYGIGITVMEERIKKAIAEILSRRYGVAVEVYEE